jgi:hypothetical protein
MGDVGVIGRPAATIIVRQRGGASWSTDKVVGHERLPGLESLNLKVNHMLKEARFLLTFEMST